MVKATKKIKDIILYGSDDEEINLLMMMDMKNILTKKHLKV